MHFGLPLRVANGNSDIDPAFCVCVCVCVLEMVILVGCSENVCAVLYGVFGWKITHLQILQGSDLVQLALGKRRYKAAKSCEPVM